MNICYSEFHKADETITYTTNEYLRLSPNL